MLTHNVGTQLPAKLPSSTSSSLEKLSPPSPLSVCFSTMLWGRRLLGGGAFRLWLGSWADVASPALLVPVVFLRLIFHECRAWNGSRTTAASAASELLADTCFSAHCRLCFVVLQASTSRPLSTRTFHSPFGMSGVRTGYVLWAHWATLPGWALVAFRRGAGCPCCLFCEAKPDVCSARAR